MDYKHYLLIMIGVFAVLVIIWTIAFFVSPDLVPLFEIPGAIIMIGLWLGVWSLGKRRPAAPKPS